MVEVNSEGYNKPAHRLAIAFAACIYIKHGKV